MENEQRVGGYHFILEKTARTPDGKWPYIRDHFEINRYKLAVAKQREQDTEKPSAGDVDDYTEFCEKMLRLNTRETVRLISGAFFDANSPRYDTATVGQVAAALEHAPAIASILNVYSVAADGSSTATARATTDRD